MFPSLPALVRSAKMAVARREQGVGGLRLWVSGKPLFDRCDRPLILAEGKSRVGDKLEGDFSVVRVQTHIGFERFDRAGRVAGEDLNTEPSI